MIARTGRFSQRLLPHHLELTSWRGKHTSTYQLGTWCDDRDVSGRTSPASIGVVAPQKSLPPHRRLFRPDERLSRGLIVPRGSAGLVLKASLWSKEYSVLYRTVECCAIPEHNAAG